MRSSYQNDFEFRRLFRAYFRSLEFSGRSTRTELIGYWMATWILSYLVIFVMIGETFAPVDRPLERFAAVGAFLVFFIPAPALHIRRAHDAGFSTVVGLLTLLLTILQLILPDRLDRNIFASVGMIVICLCVLALLLWQPQYGPNEYGPDPRLAT